MYVFLWKYVFISYGLISRSGIDGSYVEYVFNLIRHCQAVFKVIVLFCILTSSVLRFPVGSVSLSVLGIVSFHFPLTILIGV